MENKEPESESLEEALSGGGVFTNEGELTEALRENAKALGINPDIVAPEQTDEPRLKFYARGNCKHCYGRGVIKVIISPSKRKVFWKNERQPTRVSFRQKKKARSRRIGPTRPVTKKILNVAEGNETEWEWDTRLPEPHRFKENNLSQAFCRCIRAVEV